MRITTGGSLITEKQERAAQRIKNCLLYKGISTEDQFSIIEVSKKYFSQLQSEDFESFLWEFNHSMEKVREAFKRIIIIIEDRFHLNGKEAIEVLDYYREIIIEESCKKNIFGKIIDFGKNIADHLVFEVHEDILLGENLDTNRCSYLSDCFKGSSYSTNPCDSPIFSNRKLETQFII
ncbi:MAG: hypothetical protein V1865_01880 [bacterium]